MLLVRIDVHKLTLIASLTRLPQIINRIVEAGISFERVREFLLCEEYKSVGEGTLKEKGEVLMRNGTFVYDSKKPRLDETDGGGGNKTGGIGALKQQHQRMMQEAALDRQWEYLLMKAQLRDAEDQIHELEKELHPERVYDDPNNDDGGGEGKWSSPSSLLSLRRVTMHCEPGEFVAVVGAVGAGKVSKCIMQVLAGVEILIFIFNCFLLTFSPH